MVRAATWLHFGSGGAARARISTTVDVDAAPGEIDRERQPDRSRANDKHVGFGHSSSTPEFLTTTVQRSNSVLM